MHVRMARAPGGSDRRKRHKPNESWDMQIKKSITDLIDSPQKKNSTPARPALETSTFFPENAVSPCERKTLSFPAPGGLNVSKSLSPNGYQGPSIPTATHGSDQSSSAGGQEDAVPRPGKHGGVRLDS